MPELSAKLTFISDPGHGWLRVPLADIVVLGVEGEVTTFSFIEGKFAYLEEDVDCPRYLTALTEQGYPQPEITVEYVDRFERPPLRFRDPTLTWVFWDRLKK